MAELRDMDPSIMDAGVQEALLLQKIVSATRDASHTGPQAVEQAKLNYILFLHNHGKTDVALRYVEANPEMKGCAEVEALEQGMSAAA